MDPSSAPAVPDAPADSSPADIGNAAPDTPAPAADSGVTSAAPPAAEPAAAPEPEPKLVDAIAQAVKKPEADAKPEDKAVKPDPADKAPQRKSAEDQAAEDAKLPFGKHPRWKQVIGENQELRKFRDSVTPQLQEFGKITDFMQRNEIAPEEMQGLYVLAAMLKHEPAKALDTLRKMIEPLEQFVGDRLPADLQDEVNDGVITEARAKEIARLRNQEKFQGERTQQQQERTVRENEVALRREQARVVSDWEQRTRAADPDYPQYQEWVALELKRLHAEKPARTPQEALGYAEQAYKTVKAKFQRALSRGQPDVPRGPSSTSVPGSTGRQPQPSNMLDAIRQAL